MGDTRSNEPSSRPAVADGDAVALHLDGAFHAAQQALVRAWTDFQELIGAARPKSDRPQQTPEGVRRAEIVWNDASGREVSQPALLQSDDAGRPRALVRYRPADSFLQVREKGSTYAVALTSTVPTAGGFELRLSYLQEGRRREQRVASDGPALLEVPGQAAAKADVLNASPGGLQLHSTRSVDVGAAVRISGASTVYLGVIRYCKPSPGGYTLGVQLFGDDGEYR